MWRGDAPQRRSLVSLVLSWVGHVLALVWLQSVFPPFLVPIVALAPVICTWVAISGTGLVRLIARVGMAGYMAFLSYLVVTLGYLLAWTQPFAVWAIIGTLAAGWLISTARRTRHRVPLSLPLGLSICLCLLGWYREDGAIRCDDYRAVTAQSGVQLVIPSSRELATCTAGELLRVWRYPRKAIETPDAQRLVVLTQDGITRAFPAGRVVPSTLTGSICALDAGPDAQPQCLGEGKAQAIGLDEKRDSLYIAAWAQQTPELKGALNELPLHGPWRVLRQLRFTKNVGEGFVDPVADIAGYAVDEADELIFVRPSTMERLHSIPSTTVPADAHYDVSRHEGVFCGSEMPGSPLYALALAIKPQPFELRGLGREWQVPWSFIGITEGCDWDPAGRRVYVALANLGLLATVDYDTGAYLRSRFVGFGARGVTYDARRRHIYVANFLRGSIMELDLADGRVIRSWFAGRFLRFLSLSRDGRSLLAASNVGVTRIALE